MMNKVILVSICVSFCFVGAAFAETLGYWEFDTPDAVLKDSSGNGLDGRMGFAVSTETDPIPVTDTPSGKPGDRALDIVGGPVVADDSADKLLELSGQPFTVEIWIKVKESLDGLSWRGTIYYGRHGQGWGVGTRDSDLKFTLFGVVDMFPGIQLLPDGQWHHYACLYEPNIGVTFYVDGQEVAYMDEGRDMIPAQTTILWLGTEDGASRPIPAKLDRFRVSRGLLDPSQLDSDPANPKGVTADTIVYFPFDEESGPQYMDVAGGLVGLAGTAWFALKQSPEFVPDTPSGQGYSLEFEQGDHAVIYDPDQKLNFEYHNFTLEVWAKPGQFPGDTGFLLRYGGSEAAPPDSGGYGLSLNQANGSLGFSFYRVTSGGGTRTVSTPANVFPFDDQWHHIAAVYDEENFMVRFFVDGQLVHEEEYIEGIITAKDVYVLHLGSDWDGRSMYVGKMDRVRVSNESLTPEQFDYQEPVVGVDLWSLY